MRLLFAHNSHSNSLHWCGICGQNKIFNWILLFLFLLSSFVLVLYIHCFGLHCMDFHRCVRIFPILSQCCCCSSFVFISLLLSVYFHSHSHFLDSLAFVKPNRWSDVKNRENVLQIAAALDAINAKRKIIGYGVDNFLVHPEWFVYIVKESNDWIGVSRLNENVIWFPRDNSKYEKLTVLFTTT